MSPPHNIIYNSSREDKENINTITLSTDDSDCSSGGGDSAFGVITGGGVQITPGEEDSGVDEDDTESLMKINKMPPTNNTNAKLPGRQTNNSLSSLTGNIFIPPFSNSGGTTGSGGGGGSSAGGIGTSASSSSVKDESQSQSQQQQQTAPIRKKKVKSSEV